ncbi:hypothetical protein FXO37_08822 [Capsicum annuum]|nr:hypothetical protein FXO37_08822 [Capsicum annuum]
MLFLRPKNVFVQRVFLPGVKFGDRTLPAIVIAATLIYITFSSPSKRDGLGSAEKEVELRVFIMPNKGINASKKDYELNSRELKGILNFFFAPGHHHSEEKESLAPCYVFWREKSLFIRKGVKRQSLGVKASGLRPGKRASLGMIGARGCCGKAGGINSRLKPQWSLPDNKRCGGTFLELIGDDLGVGLTYEEYLKRISPIGLVRIDKPLSRPMMTTEYPCFGNHTTLLYLFSVDPVGKVAYELALPPYFAVVHPIFHVSMPRKYIPDLSHVLRSLAVFLLIFTDRGDDLGVGLTYEEYLKKISPIGLEYVDIVMMPGESERGKNIMMPCGKNYLYALIFVSRRTVRLKALMRREGAVIYVITVFVGRCFGRALFFLCPIPSYQKRLTFDQSEKCFDVGPGGFLSPPSNPGLNLGQAIETTKLEYGLDMPRILLKERGAFGNADTGGVGLSSARTTAGDKPEEGEDDVKSSCPLCPGLDTCYNGQDKGSRSREGELTPNFELQAATRLHEDGIASNRRLVIHNYLTLLTVPT